MSSKPKPFSKGGTTGSTPVVKNKGEPSKTDIPHRATTGRVSSKGKQKREKAPPIPGFLAKTLSMLQNPEFKNSISWSPDGTVVIVSNIHTFSKEVLPKYFKHSNLASFVRQLNMYGFKKVSMDKDSQRFQHPLFTRDGEHNLHKIKRKTMAKQMLVDRKREETTNELVSEIQKLRKEQEKYEKMMLDLQGKNAHLEAENATLWKQMEVAKDRQSALANKMQRIMIFLFDMFGDQNAQKNLKNSNVPMLMDKQESDPSQKEREKMKTTLEALGVDLKGPAPTLSKSDTKGEAATATKLPSFLEDIDSDLKTQAATISKLPSFSTSPTLKPSSKSTYSSMEAPSLQRIHSLAMDGDNFPPADSLEQTPSMFSMWSSFEKDPSTPKPDKETREEYNKIAQGLDKHLNDQDLTLKRIATIESVLSDPGEMDMFTMESEQEAPIVELMEKKRKNGLMDEVKNPKKLKLEPNNNVMSIPSIDAELFDGGLGPADSLTRT